jgi:hypothetical protein
VFWNALFQTQVLSIMTLPPSRNLVILIAILGLAGCEHMGPGTIVDDRVPYNEAIATSWKQQTLLNIVRLRYVDVPEFIDVPSIVSGYGLDRTTMGTFSANIFPSSYLNNFLTLGLGGSRTMSDHPTISYSPQTGSEFTRNLTNPIPPAAILNLIESGTPADVVMELAVESINGIRNRQFIGQIQPADPEFHQVLQIMKKAQASGQVSLRVAPGNDKDKKSPDVLMTIQDKDIDPALAAELAQMRKMLHLDPEVREFKIVFGMLPQDKTEIAFRTRSVLRIMTYLALNVQVPAAHLADGRAIDVGDSGEAQPQLTVHSGCKMPCDSYAAVCYQGYWFWIEQSDFHSKRSMMYLKLLLALADTGQKDAGPALTIRAN